MGNLNFIYTKRGRKSGRPTARVFPFSVKRSGQTGISVPLRAIPTAQRKIKTPFRQVSTNTTVSSKDRLTGKISGPSPKNVLHPSFHESYD